MCSSGKTKNIHIHSYGPIDSWETIYFRYFHSRALPWLVIVVKCCNISNFIAWDATSTSEWQTPFKHAFPLISYSVYGSLTGTCGAVAAIPSMAGGSAPYLGHVLAIATGLAVALLAAWSIYNGSQYYRVVAKDQPANLIGRYSLWIQASRCLDTSMYATRTYATLFVERLAMLSLLI